MGDDGNDIPGYCSRCFAWLGATTVVAEPVDQSAMWQAQNVADLVATIPHLTAKDASGILERNMS